MTESIDWNDGYDDEDEAQRPRSGPRRRLWRTRSRTVAPDATCRPVSALGGDGGPPNDETPDQIERFKHYLAARKTAGLGPSDPDTDETERLWP